MERLSKWPELTPNQVAELVHLLCYHGSGDILAEIANDMDLFAAPGPKFGEDAEYAVQGEIALIGLSARLPKQERTVIFDFALLQALRSIDAVFSQLPRFVIAHVCENLFGDEDYVPARAEDWLEFAALARRLARRQMNDEESRKGRQILNAFAERLESRMAEGGQAKGKAVSGSKKEPAKKRSKKTKPKRRKAP